MKGHQYFEPTLGGHASAMDLVNQINNLGRGKYLHDDEQICVTFN